MSDPSPRQLDLLFVIDNFRTQHGYSPTVREICPLMNITTNSVMDLINACAKKGLLSRNKGMARTLIPTTEGNLVMEKDNDEH